ncbi:MAG: TRAP transporter small permease subunit [Alphaproteobacteria bacterium]
MRVFLRSIEFVSRVFGSVAALLVLVLMTLMVYEVVMRYAFAAPTIWSYDVSTMTLGTIFLLSISYALATDAHVRVDLLHTFLGRHARPIVDLCGHALVMLPLLIWLAWRLWGHFHGAYLSMERTGASAWNPLVWPFRAVMFIGVVAWALQTVAEIFKAVLTLTGRMPAEQPSTGQ